MANSVHPDATARYEPSHQDLHCLQRYLHWSAEMKAINIVKLFVIQNNIAAAQISMRICTVWSGFSWKFYIINVSVYYND